MMQEGRKEECAIDARHRPHRTGISSFSWAFHPKEAPFYRRTHAYDGGSCEAAATHRPCGYQIAALFGGFRPLHLLMPGRGGVTKLQYYYNACACNHTWVGNP